MTPTNSEALTAAGGTPPSGPRIALGVSRDLEFHSSDGPGKINRRNALPCVAQAAKRIQERAETANSLGVPGPSDAFQLAGHRSSRPANLLGSLPAFSSTVALLKAIDIAEALTDRIGMLLLFLFIISIALSTPVVLWALLFLDLG